jgi:nitrogen-specific signal transduction histidine kinase
VRDEGQGLDPSQRDKVYTMFYSERTHGAGIGLALVRQIVDAHGGTIEMPVPRRQNLDMPSSPIAAWLAP